MQDVKDGLQTISRAASDVLHSGVFFTRSQIISRAFPLSQSDQEIRKMTDMTIGKVRYYLCTHLICVSHH